MEKGRFSFPTASQDYLDWFDGGEGKNMENWRRRKGEENFFVII